MGRGPKPPPDQRSKFEVRLEGGFGKMQRPPETNASHVQGCGDPGCPICMPKGEPSRGALGGDDVGIDRASISGFCGTVYVSDGRGAWTEVSAARSVFQGRRESGSDVARRREEEARRPVEKYFLRTEHKTGWNDVVGNEPARAALIEAIEHPVKYAELYAAYRKKQTKGVLLYGPPGCGKTMFGKAAASVLAELHGRKSGEHTMLHIAGPEIQSPYVGVTEEIIRNILAYAAAYKARYGYPLVVFIDEADSILPSRDGAGGRRALPWEESNVATFLAEMDGLEDSGALVILATNRPESIDAAILRDGRCDRKIKVERPSREAAQVIFERCLEGVPLSPGCNAAEVADYAVGSFFLPHRRLVEIKTEKATHYLTLGDIVNGAMIGSIVEMAKGNAFRRDLARDGKPSGVGQSDIEEAIVAVTEQNRDVNHSYALIERVDRLGLSNVPLMASPIRHASPALIYDGGEAIH